jgi:hypothetical protein
MVCVRRAWLVLGGSTLELEDYAAGYYCTTLDLGYPEIREVVENRPAPLDGTIDRSALFGSRAVSANLTGQSGHGMTADQIATLFAPFMLPSVRPQLHYVLDRPGTPERVLTVRAAGYSWPISGSASRDIQLSWVAPDPIMYDPVVRSAVAFAGSGAAAGRVYPLTFNRVYPVGGMSPTTGTITSDGDVAPVRPVLRIYGPITTPVVHLQATGPGFVTDYWVVFVAGFRIDPGHWVDVDTAAKTAYTDTGLSVMSSIDWQQSVWPVLPVAPGSTAMTMTGSSTSQVTQVVATWQDGFLT